MDDRKDYGVATRRTTGGKRKNYVKCTADIASMPDCLYWRGVGDNVKFCVWCRMIGGGRCVYIRKGEK